MGAEYIELTDDLNLHVDLNQVLGERVDLHKTGIHSSGETAEPRNKTNVTLGHWLVWIRAAEAEWNGSQVTNAATEGVDHASVPPMLGIFGVGLDDRGVRWLQVFATWRFDVHNRFTDSRT